MSRPIDVFHPVPMRFTPSGGRFERLGFVGMRTPVRIAEIEPRAFEPLGVLAGKPPSGYMLDEHTGPRNLYLRGDDVWFDLHGPDGRRIDLEALSAFLGASGTIEGRDWSDLACHFARSPVIVREARDRTRGAAAPPPMRGVRWDGTEHARAALARFFREDIALVGGAARARLPAAVVAASHSGAMRQIRAQLELFPRESQVTRAWGDASDPASMLRSIGALERSGYQVVMPGEEGVARYLGIRGDPIPPGAAPGGRARLFANGCHAEAMRLSVVGEAIRAAEAGGSMPDDVGAALARARDWEARGAIFSTGPEDVEACLLDFEAFVGTLRSTFRRPGNSPSLARLRRILEHSAFPDLRDRAGPSDDVELAGLAPGP